MRKVLALILSVLTALCIFSACGEDKKKIADSDAVQAAVCEYTDLLCCGSEGAYDYVIKGSATYNKTEEIVEKISSFDTFVQENIAVEDSGELVKDLTYKLAELIEYDVTKAKVNKNTATVTVKLEAPRVDDVESIINKIEEDGEVLSLLSEEELAEYRKNGSLVKYTDLLYEEALKELEKTIKTTEIVFKAEKIDGDWFVMEFNEK